MKKKPNILFLMTDQQRPDSLGCYGNAVAITPNIDRLSGGGVTFENCYVQNPLCCPSRYSILTGRYPRSHRVRSNWYAPRTGEQSFGHRLGRSGYSTAAIGKMHFTPWDDCFGFDGRIIAEAPFNVECPDDYARFLIKNGHSRKNLHDTTSEEYIQSCTAVKSKLPQQFHIDTFVGRSTCEYLRNVTEPFCLFTSFLGPHNPYSPPGPYDQLFIDRELPPRNMGEDEVSQKPREAYTYINNRLKWPFKTDELTAQQLQITKAYYYSSITLIDDWIGRIIDVLKQQDLYDETIIVFCSDHGDLLGDHGLVYKQCFYEQSVKVPLIFHAPKRFAARRIEEPVEAMDIFSTLCDFGNAWGGEGVQAKSLRPFLDGDQAYTHREAVFSENWFGRMVRYVDFKMVYYPGKPYGELYNLAEDPNEQDNLWEKLADSHIKRELKDLLLEWSFQSEDPLPLPVRPDHFDVDRRQFRLAAGGTEECERQFWYLQNLIDLYDSWEFSESGESR